MARGDRGLERVRTEWAAQSLRAIERIEAATDEQVVPARTILIEQEHGLTGRSDPGVRTRGLNLEERDEAVDLSVARHQRRDDATHAQGVFA